MKNQNQIKSMKNLTLGNKVKRNFVEIYCFWFFVFLIEKCCTFNGRLKKNDYLFEFKKTIFKSSFNHYLTILKSIVSVLYFLNQESKQDLLEDIEKKKTQFKSAEQAQINWNNQTVAEQDRKKIIDKAMDENKVKLDALTKENQSLQAKYEEELVKAAATRTSYAPGKSGLPLGFF